jgi:hypothetical protein
VSILGFPAAVTPAAAPAAQPYSDPVDLVNTDSGYPASERYPGALDPAEHQASEADQYLPTTPGGPEGPVFGDQGGEPFTETLPHQAPGGGYQDSAWRTGHDGPQAPWDSSSGGPFAPSGPVPPALHGTDTGGVFNREHVTPAAIGSLTRRTQPGQTTIRNGSGDQALKDNVTSPNGRTDLDQYQYWNPDGYDPWEIPYGERAVQNNLAWESQQISPTGSPYTPSGYLPDRSVYDYAAEAYEAPPDPDVGTGAAAAAAAGSGGIGGGWV